MTDLDQYWLRRFQAVGKAQARYLWVLLIAMLFYAAVRARVVGVPTETLPPLSVPLVGLEIDAATVFASGPVVLSFLVLVVIGSLRAFEHAREKLKLGTGGDYMTEQVDVHPNAIDLAVYTPIRSRSIPATIGYFAYPAFLVAALAEATWLGWSLVGPSEAQLGSLGWFIAALVVWVPAVWLVGAMIVGRVKNVPKLWKASAA
jgi:hypothetical protein